jgi:hypothetical protein
LSTIDHISFGKMVVRRKKYRLTKSNIICQPKDQGGLGVQNIELQNQCLLSKWLFKLLNKDGLWQTILRKKYLANQTLGKAQKRPGVSHFWASLMDAKQSFLRYGSFQLNNGKQIRFWEDKWLGNSTFKHQFLSLYNMGPILYKPLQMLLDSYKPSQNLLSLVCHQDAIS